MPTNLDSLLQVAELLALFERLKQQHTAVSTRTAALHTTCERLVAEREALVGVAEAIRAKLTYFDELDRVAVQVRGGREGGRDGAAGRGSVGGEKDGGRNTGQLGWRWRVGSGEGNGNRWRPHLTPTSHPPHTHLHTRIHIHTNSQHSPPLPLLLQFQAATLSLDAGDLLPLLQKLDDCIGYVSANPQYADASAYAARFRQLQARALAAVRAKVQQALRTASMQVQSAVRAGGAAGAPVGGAATAGGPAGGGPAAAAAAGGAAANGAAVAEGAEAAMLYVRFRAAAEPALKGGDGGRGCVAGSVGGIPSMLFGMAMISALGRAQTVQCMMCMCHSGRSTTAGCATQLRVHCALPLCRATAGH